MNEAGRKELAGKDVRRLLSPRAMPFVIGCLAVLLTCAAAFWPAGCRKAPLRPKVILIAIDTLRADRLGCDGSPLGLTPNIDAFAAQGVVFKNAFSHAPWTLPSFASLLSSTYPVQHGAGIFLGKGRYTTPRRNYRSLGHVFQEAGYRTAALVNVLFLSSSFGMNRGFDEVDYVPNRGNHLVRTADKTTDTALTWVGKHRDEPFFLMVHYFDPHLLYEAPPAFRRAHAREQDRNTDDPLFGNAGEIIAYRKGEITLGPEMIDRLEGLYNAEVAFTDSEVGRFLDGLKRMGLEDSAIVVLTADHGEEFYDHGGFEHGHTLYDELIHVPLVFRWPGKIPAGRTVDTVVRHVDVAPTLCRLAAVPPGENFEGDDLAPLWRDGASGPDRPVFCEGNHWGANLLCRRAGGYKTIVHMAPRSVEVYDLKKDPGEKNDISTMDPALLQRLVQDLFLCRQGMMKKAGRGAPAELTPEEERRLRELGYGG